MDRKQLMLELEDFKLACLEKDGIRQDNPSVFEFEEIYKDIFIINVAVKKEGIVNF